MNDAQKRLYDALLAMPPEHPNGDAVDRFWKGYALEAAGIAADHAPDIKSSLMWAAFQAGRAHRRRGGKVPERVRKSLPALFAEVS